MWSFIDPFGEKKKGYSQDLIFILYFEFSHSFLYDLFLPAEIKGVNTVQATNSLQIISNCTRKHTVKFI